MHQYETSYVSSNDMFNVLLHSDSYYSYGSSAPPSRDIYKSTLAAINQWQSSNNLATCNEDHHDIRQLGNKIQQDMINQKMLEFKEHFDYERQPAEFASVATRKF